MVLGVKFGLAKFPRSLTFMKSNQYPKQIESKRSRNWRRPKMLKGGSCCHNRTSCTYDPHTLRDPANPWAPARGSHPKGPPQGPTLWIPVVPRNTALPLNLQRPKEIAIPNFAALKWLLSCWIHLWRLPPKLLKFLFNPILLRDLQTQKKVLVPKILDSDF